MAVEDMRVMKRGRVMDSLSPLRIVKVKIERMVEEGKVPQSPEDVRFSRKF